MDSGSLRSRTWTRWLVLASLGASIVLLSGCTTRYETVRRLTEPSQLAVPVARSGSTVVRLDTQGDRLGRWRVRRHALTVYRPDGVVKGRVLERSERWVLIERDGTERCELRLDGAGSASLGCADGPRWTLTETGPDQLRLEVEGGVQARLGLDAEGRWTARVGHARSGLDPAIIAEPHEPMGWQLKRSRPERLTTWRGRDLDPRGLLAAECVLGPCAPSGAVDLQEVAALVYLAARALGAAEPAASEASAAPGPAPEE